MELFVLNRNKGNHLTVCNQKVSAGSFKNAIYKMSLVIIFDIYV